MDLDSSMEFDLRLDFLNAEAHGMTINPKEVRSSQLDQLEVRGHIWKSTGKI